MKRISISLVSNDVFFSAQYVTHQANCALHSFCALEMLILIIMQIHQKVSTFVRKLNRKKELKWSMSGCNVVGNGKEIYSSWNWSMGYLCQDHPMPNETKSNDMIGLQTENIQHRICFQCKMRLHDRFFLLKMWFDGYWKHGMILTSLKCVKKNGNNFASFLKNFDRFS